VPEPVRRADALGAFFLTFFLAIDEEGDADGSEIVQVEKKRGDCGGRVVQREGERLKIAFDVFGFSSRRKA
jgi:hypothetical protein